jgi:LAGLIDADG endonuclease
MVTYIIIIWLFAGNFIFHSKFCFFKSLALSLEKGQLDGEKERVSPPMKTIVGKIFNSNFISLVQKKLINKKSADNPLGKILTLNLYSDQASVPGSGQYWETKTQEKNRLNKGKDTNKTKTETIFNSDKPLISKDLIISDHLKIHKKPSNDINLGYYLAGLIEGIGTINQNNITLQFSYRDISLAYFIKKSIGYGSVTLDKKTKICNYIVSKEEGRKRILNLINGKLRGNPAPGNIIKQFIDFNYDVEFNTPILPPARFNLLSNHWLAGFSDAHSNFFIKIFPMPNKAKNKNELNDSKIDLNLNFTITPPSANSITARLEKMELFSLLNDIYLIFGGAIIPALEFNKSNQDSSTSYYISNTFGEAKRIINYFDIYHLNSYKYINYIKWRKAYRIIQRNEHTTTEGLNKIIKIKNSLIP